MIDVSRALGLLHKSGNTLTLSDKGYALYAVQQFSNSDQTKRALLLHSVLESDGEATLNLLDIIANADTSASLGESLVKRLLRILDLRESWAKQHLQVKFARDLILQELSDSKRRLATAVVMERKQTHTWSAYTEEQRLTPKQKVERFYTHTVNPRKGWLKDLGCIEEHGRQKYHVTETGHRILTSFKEASCYAESLFLFPFSVEVCQLLGVTAPWDIKDLFWQALASSFVDTPTPVRLSPDEHFPLIESIYPHVTFQIFNEAAIESIHDALAAHLATNGQYVKRQFFTDFMESTFKAFPDKVYRLRQRHGGSGYIAIKSNLG